MSKDDILSKISQIKVSEVPSKIPDDFTARSLREIALERERTDLENIKDSFALSGKMATRIFWLVFFYLAVVFCIVIWQGIVCPEYRLSDKVLIALLTTTTVNIIGLLFLVIKYVFHHRLKIGIIHNA